MVSNEYKDLLFGKPIRSLQTLLRELSHYVSLPRVVPDGKFDEKTESAVKEFQSQNGLDPTGKADFETWNKIVEKYNEAMRKNVPRLESEKLKNTIEIKPGDKNILLPVLQAKIKTLSILFKNIPDLTISGVHDEKSVNAIMEIQKLSKFNQNGIIDDKTHTLVERIYNDFAGTSFSEANPLDFIGKF